MIQVERSGQGPRKLTLKLVPGTRNVFEGALPQAAEGEYQVRLMPPPVLEGPIPTASFRVEAPVNEFERIEMNEPELIRAAESTRRQVLYASDRGNAAQRPAQAIQGPARYGSADSALEHLARSGLVPGADHRRSGFSGNANKWYDSVWWILVSTI